ncbi:MAG TPA: LysM peptidoglycan-binding domain-containing protein, partial [Anaerolineales bacterium]|nr:LysM peptidoglycan-binding domain-containing protein [Anaerolineales bacterium]
MQKSLLLSLLLLVACTSAPVTTETTDASLQPYLTGTPASTASPNVLVILDTPVPTNTPQVYIIESGDTISEIADKFKIPQSDLLAANPDADPNALVIGQTLIIPDPSAQPIVASTLTPIPVPVTQAACHPTADSGLWCFALIQNNTVDPLENISAQITLFDENMNPAASQIAYPPLDIIAPNSSLPVSVYFPNIAGNFTPQIQVLSAMPGSGTSLLPAVLN